MSVPCVCVVDSSVAQTGGLVGACNIARALEGRARRILVLPANSAVPDKDLEIFDKVCRLPIANLRRTIPGALLYLPKLLIASGWLHRLMRESECQVLILNDFYLMHGAVCRALGFGGRVLTWVRMDPWIFGRTLAEFWLWQVARSSDKIVVVSRYIGDRLPRQMAAKTSLVYDPLHRKCHSASTARLVSNQRMTFVANYIRGKGQDHALDAFARIAGEFPAANLAFYGGDMGLEKNRAYRRELEAKAISFGICNQVTFGDFVPDPSKVLGKSFLALNFSTNESFSMTVLEASGAGLPVIATRCGGPEEIIVDGETGLLVPVGKISEMAVAMRALLSDPGRAAAMGRAGRERVEQVFSAAQYEASLLQLLPNPR